MATLTLDEQPSGRDIENSLGELEALYRRLEDCEDSKDLRSYARDLQVLIKDLSWTADNWEHSADEAERREEEEEDCYRHDPNDEDCDCSGCRRERW